MIEYTLTGALRTFDGVPELHWDVTGPDYPPTDAFDVTVTAPGGVAKGRCLAGPDECDTTLRDGAAHLSGQRPAGTVTAVAALVPGNVANAEPTLEERSITSPELLRQTSRFQLDQHGILHVTADLDYVLPPERGEHLLRLTLPLRIPHDEERDRVFAVTPVDVSATGGTVTASSITPAQDRAAKFSTQEGHWRISVEGAKAITVHLEYRVAGAVTVDGGSATLHVPAGLGEELALSGESHRITLPAAPSAARLSDLHVHGTWAPSEDEWRIRTDGSDVVAEYLGQAGWGRPWVTLVLPASALDEVSDPLEPSLDAAAARHEQVGVIGGGAGALLLAVAGGLGAWLLRPRDWRYTDTAPGVEGIAGQVTTRRRAGQIPVRFEPPQLDSLATAGLIWDRGFRPGHLAAGITALAAQGSIELHAGSSWSAPHVRKTGTPPADSTFLGRVHHYLPDDGAIERSRIERLAGIMHQEANGRLGTSGYFSGRRPGRGRKILLFSLGIVAPALAWAGFWASGPGGVLPMPQALAGNWLLAAGVTLGAWIGLAAAVVWPLPRARSAKGTMLWEQMEGFKRYLETAEGHQLQFEEGRDIYREYLPWAVLFGVTEQWARACEAMASRGDVAAPDRSFLGGVSVGELTSTVSTMAGISTSGGSSSSGSSGAAGRAARPGSPRAPVGVEVGAPARRAGDHHDAAPQLLA